MKTTIDTTSRTVVIEDGHGRREFPLASADGFAAISAAWLQAGWDAKYVYSFTWLGRPIIQLPEDLLRLQEVIHTVRPTLIIETGVAHGGGLVFYASLLKAMGLEQARVIGIDIEIRPHNRQAIESHVLSPMITLIEGNSIPLATVEATRSLVRADDRVMVILDSNHLRDHVLEELRAYSPLVSPDSFIVVCDGIMRDLVGAPRSADDWAENNPVSAVRAFLQETADFVEGHPPFQFNEGAAREPVTYWPAGYLKRRNQDGA